jgi:phage shock protein A
MATLKPELLTTLTNLGITEPELETLRSRMMGAVTGLEANLSALNLQIEQLTAQRDAILAELQQAHITVSKLINSEEPPAGE